MCKLCAEICWIFFGSFCTHMSQAWYWKHKYKKDWQCHDYNITVLYQKTNSMVKTSNYSADQEISHIMAPESSFPCSQKLVTGLTLSHLNLVHNFTSYFSKIRFSIIFLPWQCLSRNLFPWSSLTTSLQASHLSHECCYVLSL